MAKYVGKRIVPLPCGEWVQNREYEMLSVVLHTATGDSYMARRQVPVGTAITDTTFWAKSSEWSQQIKNYSDQLTETLRQVRADNDETEQAIRQDNAATKQHVDTSLEETTADLTSRMNQAAANLNQASEQMQNTEALLTARLDSIVGGATEDTEILDARVDAEGKTHENLGNAARSVLPRIKEIFLKRSNTNLVPGDEYWEIGNINPETGEDSSGNSNCRTTIYIPVDGARKGTAFFSGEDRQCLIFVLYYSDEGFISRSTIFQDPVQGSKKIFTIPNGTTRIRLGAYRQGHLILKELIPEGLFIGLGENYQSFPDREVVDVESTAGRNTGDH